MFSVNISNFDRCYVWVTNMFLFYFLNLFLTSLTEMRSKLFHFNEKLGYKYASVATFIRMKYIFDIVVTLTSVNMTDQVN